jgi:hypothetical protein
MSQLKVKIFKGLIVFAFVLIVIGISIMLLALSNVL